MWAVKKKTLCLENSEYCGQPSCELCSDLSDAWNKNAGGYCKEHHWYKNVNGTCKVCGDKYWYKNDDISVDGFWEWNWRKTQEQRVSIAREQEKLKREIRMNSGAGLKHVLWMIGLPEDYDLKDMLNKLKILVNDDKYQMGQSLACIEYFSKKNPEGGNLHIHIIVINHGKMKPSAQTEHMAKFFGIEENHIDRQTYRKPEDFENGVNYVLGLKQCPEKVKHHKKDVIWRIENHLPQLTCSFPADVYAKYVKNIVENT